MNSTSEVYRLAGTLDFLINSLFEKHRVTINNARYWLLFCRTVKSSLNIIEEIANEMLKVSREVPSNESPQDG